MSHDRGWRAACIVTIWILRFHSKMHEVARGVTAMVVGSGALLAVFFFSEYTVDQSEESCASTDNQEGGNKPPK